MSKSWMSGQGSSPGFMYFQSESSENKTPEPNPKDRDDYLAFGESPSRYSFSPNNYSSPQRNFQRGNRRQNNRPRYSVGYNNRSFNRSFNDSPNNSYGSNSSNFEQKSQSNDIRRYMHNSFTEDPWAALEKHLNESMGSSQRTSDPNEIASSNV